MNNVTILVNSCDKYEDAWEPFFKLLKIHWPECENYKIILNTESKVYNCDFLNVTTICGGNGRTWSQRFKDVLNKIETECVFCIMEDFFLKSKVDNEEFLKTVEYMHANKNVGYISLKYKPERVLKDGTVNTVDKYIERDSLPVNYRVPLISALWRREWLIKIIREHESPWEFEEYASRRSARSDYKVLDVNNNGDVSKCIYDYDIDLEFGVGISRGMWLPKTKDLFDKYGITVNFDNLGINYNAYNRAIGQAPCGTEKVTLEENSIKEKLYRLKKTVKNCGKNLKKTVRKIKSLV